MTIRPRRSVLYMPGSNARAIEKARTLPVDGVILDLEDAVAPDAKEDGARAGGAGRAGRRLRPREVIIRINALDTPWFADDLDAAIAARPDAILVPKISTPEQIEMIGQRLLDTHADLHIRLWAMIETPAAIFNIRALAAEAARFGEPARRLRDRHQRSRQGDARPPRAGPRPDAAVALDLRARRARLRHRRARRRLQRHRRHRGLRGRMRAGARHGLRRQDADPSEPDRAVQRGVLALAPRRSRRRARSSRRSSCRRTTARAWCRSTAAWSSACMPTSRGARSRSRRRSSGRRRVSCTGACSSQSRMQAIPSCRAVHGASTTLRYDLVMLTTWMPGTQARA